MNCPWCKSDDTVTNRSHTVFCHSCRINTSMRWSQETKSFSVPFKPERSYHHPNYNSRGYRFNKGATDDPRRKDYQLK